MRAVGWSWSASARLGFVRRHKAERGLSRPSEAVSNVTFRDAAEQVMAGSQRRTLQGAEPVHFSTPAQHRVPGPPLYQQRPSMPSAYNPPAAPPAGGLYRGPPPVARPNSTDYHMEGASPQRYKSSVPYPSQRQQQPQYGGVPLRPSSGYVDPQAQYEQLHQQAHQQQQAREYGRRQQAAFQQSAKAALYSQQRQDYERQQEYQLEQHHALLARQQQEKHAALDMQLQAAHQKLVAQAHAAEAAQVAAQKAAAEAQAQAQAEAEKLRHQSQTREPEPEPETNPVDETALFSDDGDYDGGAGYYDENGDYINPEEEARIQAAEEELALRLQVRVDIIGHARIR